ncbi:MAG: hypothetical protein WCW44_03215 [archaeon]|jgi:hypothetical protein
MYLEITFFSKKGFVFSLEATISLILFVLLLIALPTHQNSSLKELLILQQENDLLRVWSAKESSPQEMLMDTKLLFGETGELWINETQLNKAKSEKNSIASEGIILDNSLVENKIRLIVYYN